MRWHVALRLGGAALLVAAVTVLMLQVHVGGSGTAGRWCGSPFDVLADRAGWPEWYAHDLADPAAGSPLLRTLDCPDAVNHRSLAAGLLGAGGLVALGAGMTRRPARSGGAAVDPSRRLVVLGRTVAAIGIVLAVAGVASLAVLLANGDSALFLYVSRPFVAVVGLVLLVPVIALIAGGRAITIVARGVRDRQDGDATR